MAGALTGTVALSGQPTAPDVAAQLQTELLKYNNLLVRDAALDAEIVDGGDAPSEVALSVANLQVDAQAFSDLGLTVSGQRDAHTITAAGKGADGLAARVQANGAVDQHFNWDGALNQTSINAARHAIRLVDSAPLTYRHQDTRVSVEPHCWATGDARLCLKDTVTNSDVGTATLTLRDYQLQQLGGLLPEDVRIDGELTVDTTVSWDRTQQEKGAIPVNSTVQANVSGGVITLNDGTEIPALKLRELSLDLKSDPYSVVSELTLASEQLGNGTVGLTINPWDPERAIAGDLAMRGMNLAYLGAFLPDFQTVEGMLGVEGTIGGTLTDPQFSGQVELAGAATGI